MKNYKKYLSNKQHLEKNGAYDPAFEHDACGVGAGTAGGPGGVR